MTVITIIQVYHGVNRFLGTTSGELTKNAFELILFTLVTYMVASEWMRARQNKEKLQWLMWGFLSLSLTKLMTTLAISFLVFGGFDNYLSWPGPIARLFACITIFDTTFELFAIGLISLGFLQPVLTKNPNKLVKEFLLIRRRVMVSMLILCVFISILLSIRVYNAPQILGMYWPAFIWFNIAKILVAWSTITYISVHRSSFLAQSKYYPNLIQAMVVYSLTPILQSINQLLFNHQNAALLVLAKPFPFLAVLLFTRVIYLQIADKAALYDELATAQAKYIHEKELSDMKDDFISVVSHELKTPLTAISLWGSIMGSGRLGKISSKQKEACGIIKNESFRLAQLINDVLDLSKLDKGKIAIKLEHAELKEVCNLDSFKAMAVEKKIELLNEINNGTITEVDPDRFKQVIYNLVSNALKFTEPGGRVIVSASRRGTDTVVTVSDNGIGIPSDKLDGLFTKFYQVENHLTRKSGGTGLGLAISKQIIELHGGTISVESALGKGTTFTIRLPGMKK